MLSYLDGSLTWQVYVPDTRQQKPPNLWVGPGSSPTGSALGFLSCPGGGLTFWVSSSIESPYNSSASSSETAPRFVGLPCSETEWSDLAAGRSGSVSPS